MVFEFGTSFKIHIARIPFIPKGRDRIDSPVNENSKFAVLIPVGNLVLPQRFPGRLKFCWLLVLRRHLSLHLFERIFGANGFATVINDVIWLERWLQTNPMITAHPHQSKFPMAGLPAARSCCKAAQSVFPA